MISPSLTSDASNSRMNSTDSREPLIIGFNTVDTTTHDWLILTIDGEGTTIRDYILLKLNDAILTQTHYSKNDL